MGAWRGLLFPGTTGVQLIYVLSFCTLVIGLNWVGRHQAADLKADRRLNVDTITVESSLQRATIGETVLTR